MSIKTESGVDRGHYRRHVEGQRFWPAIDLTPDRDRHPSESLITKGQGMIEKYCLGNADSPSVQEKDQSVLFSIVRKYIKY